MSRKREKSTRTDVCEGPRLFPQDKMHLVHVLQKEYGLDRTAELSAAGLKFGFSMVLVIQDMHRAENGTSLLNVGCFREAAQYDK